MSIIDLLKSNQLFPPRRLPSLYADFRRLKVTNEDGYEANVAAWKSLLAAAVDAQVFDDVTCIKADNSLLDSLATAQEGKPRALDAVLDELVAERTIVPLSQFLGPHSIYGRQWGVRPVLSWALKTSGLWDTSWKSGLRDGVLKSEKYVSVSKLEQLGAAVLNHLRTISHDSQSYTDSIFTTTLFEKTISQISIGQKSVMLSPTDIQVVVTFLSRDQRQLVTDGSTVKVNLNGIITDPITEQDRAVASLRNTFNDVTEQVDYFSAQIESCTTRAKQALVKKNKQLAKYALKSKKMVEDAQLKAMGMLENLEKTMLQINTASTHLDVVNALQSGVSILGDFNKAIGGAERVADLMDEIREQSAETDEIGREIASLAEGHVDEDEIEHELEAMEHQELGKKLIAAPRVPETDEQLEDEIDKLVNETSNLKIAEVEKSPQKTAIPN